MSIDLRRHPNVPCSSVIKGQDIDMVPNYKYLGTLIDNRLKFTLLLCTREAPNSAFQAALPGRHCWEALVRVRVKCLEGSGRSATWKEQLHSGNLLNSRWTKH